MYDVVGAADRAVTHTCPYLHMAYHLEEIQSGGCRGTMGALGGLGEKGEKYSRMVRNRSSGIRPGFEPRL